MTSILETNYIEPTRPYSQNELQYNREKLHKKFRLGKVVAEHKCGHCYKVKEGGLKEKNILEQNNNDQGGCSVCWKYSKLPNELYFRAMDLVTEFNNKFVNAEPIKLTYNTLDIETVYYTWLYSK